MRLRWGGRCSRTGAAAICPAPPVRRLFFRPVNSQETNVPPVLSTEQPFFVYWNRILYRLPQFLDSWLHSHGTFRELRALLRDRALHENVEARIEIQIRLVVDRSYILFCLPFSSVGSVSHASSDRADERESRRLHSGLDSRHAVRRKL